MEKTTVLVADDDPEILTLIRNLLRRLELNVLEATDGDEALSKVREGTPQLVILDVMMPGHSGWEVCKAIREDEQLKGTKVIMLTGIGERLNEMTSPLYGADEYLDKPFDFKELESLVKKHLESGAA